MTDLVFVCSDYSKCNVIACKAVNNVMCICIDPGILIMLCSAAVSHGLRWYSRQNSLVRSWSLMLRSWILAHCTASPWWSKTSSRWREATKVYTSRLSLNWIRQVHIYTHCLILGIKTPNFFLLYYLSIFWFTSKYFFPCMILWFKPQKQVIMESRHMLLLFPGYKNGHWKAERYIQTIN